MKLQSIKSAVVRFAKDEEGLTIVEYAIAGGLITALVVGIFRALGTEIQTKMQELCTAVKGSAC
ncbi:Flp family type IVb pilin [Pseudomonas songnenensis]|uniref:Flp family type IVb pilin n=1 Tax=Pseudomonas songnenensis TaxID=1176259 RepID=A0ABX9UPX5_9PSED|nr:Flp family type IVb pilin [Pseudomonas songnenensis]MCQ4299410.1 Flp family type IVb pilin [Pseudomonas songnenensis]RMH94291.1 Flp family type IVb pilin [Pseudomonas songnenensis]